MGLYDDENAKIESGEVKLKGEMRPIDYNNAKNLSAKMEQALKDRKSEGTIASYARSISQQHCPRILKEYPNHKEVQGWKERAEEILKKIEG